MTRQTQMLLSPAKCRRNSCCQKPRNAPGRISGGNPCSHSDWPPVAHLRWGLLTLPLHEQRRVFRLGRESSPAGKSHCDNDGSQWQKLRDQSDRRHYFGWFGGPADRSPPARYGAAYCGSEPYVAASNTDRMDRAPRTRSSKSHPDWRQRAASCREPERGRPQRRGEGQLDVSRPHWREEIQLARRRAENAGWRDQTRTRRGWLPMRAG